MIACRVAAADLKGVKAGAGDDKTELFTVKLPFAVAQVNSEAIRIANATLVRVELVARLAARARRRRRRRVLENFELAVCRLGRCFRRLGGTRRLARFLVAFVARHAYGRCGLQQAVQRCHRGCCRCRRRSCRVAAISVFYCYCY